MTVSLEQLGPWLQPLARFEDTRRAALRRFGPRCCDLGYANAYDVPDDEALKDILAEAAARARRLELQYAPYGGRPGARRAAARQLSTVVPLPFDWRDVVLTPGAMAALSAAFRVLSAEGPGGEVVVVAPCWLDVPLYVASQGMEVRWAPVDPREHRLDLTAVEAVVGPKTRAVVLAQPCNPTGVAYRRDEIVGLSRILHERASAACIVSDECHRDYLEEGVEHVSPAESWPRTIIIYSFGKRWLLQGQRIGYAAVSPSAPDRIRLRDALVTATRVSGFGTPTALMQVALPRLLRLPAPRDRLLDRRRRLVEGLRDRGVRLVEGDGTFFLYPAVPSGVAEHAVTDLAQRGVVVLPSTAFHHPGHVRLSVTSTEEMMERALPHLGAVLGRGGLA